MKKRFVVKWIYFGNLFIGAGIIIGKEYTGVTVGNLFIGVENKEV